MNVRPFKTPVADSKPIEHLLSPNLKVYKYPDVNLTEEEKLCAKVIMVIG